MGGFGVGSGRVGPYWMRDQGREGGKRCGAVIVVIVVNYVRSSCIAVEFEYSCVCMCRAGWENGLIYASLVRVFDSAVRITDFSHSFILSFCH